MSLTHTTASEMKKLTVLAQHKNANESKSFSKEQPIHCVQNQRQQRVNTECVRAVSIHREKEGMSESIMTSQENSNSDKRRNTITLHTI